MFKCEGERSSQTSRTGSENHKVKKNGGFRKVLALAKLRNDSQTFTYRRGSQEFPDGPAVMNSPANAGDTGWISRKIPYAAEQVSLCATTTEPSLLKPVLQQKSLQ